jgi:hypothetical protein
MRDCGRLGLGLDCTLMKKPRSHQPSAGWKVYIMRAKETWVGTVEARDEHEALDRAMRDLNIREADRFRVTIRRE